MTTADPYSATEKIEGAQGQRNFHLKHIKGRAHKK